MEATQVNISNGFENIPVGIGDQFIEASAAVGPTSALNSELRSDVMVACSNYKKQSNPVDQHLQDFSAHKGGVQVPAASPGVSKCYVFKSRLQEYAQKVGLSTPVYETIKDGPSHEPAFRSTVIVNGERYESLPGFLNRKAAEQSAAEVALRELSKSGEKKHSITAPVHETGLCKNLLQEYAQKMNYAIPTYICRKDDTPGRTALFSCTVEIGGIQYIGAAAKTKKEAEIRAARTALLAIQSSDGCDAIGGQNVDYKPQYSVIPGKRKISETPLLKVETLKAKKPKKSRLKRKKQPSQTQAGIVGGLVNNDMGASFAIQVPNYGLMGPCMESSDQDDRPLMNNPLNGDGSVVEGVCCPQVGVVDSSQTLGTTFESNLSQTLGTTFESNSSQIVESSVPLGHANRIQEENIDQGIDCSIFERTPLSGELESLPLNPCLKSEDPGNHSGGEEQAHKPTI